VDQTYHLENDERQDQEIEQDRDETSVGQHGARFFSLRQGQLCPLPVEGQVVVAEIQAANDHADYRHDHILDQRIDNFAESGADDYTDRQIDYIAFHGKCLEFLQHAHATSCLYCDME